MGTAGWVLLMLICIGSVAEGVGPMLTSRCRIRWQPPQQYVELSAILEVDRYELFISTIQGQYDWKQPTIVVDGRRTRARCPALVRQIDGQYYVVVRAVDKMGKASAPSNEFAFVIQRQASQTPGAAPASDAEVDDPDDTAEMPDVRATPPRHTPTNRPRTPWGAPQW